MDPKPRLDITNLRENEREMVSQLQELSIRIDSMLMIFDFTENDDYKDFVLSIIDEIRLPGDVADPQVKRRIEVLRQEVGRLKVRELKRMLEGISKKLRDDLGLCSDDECFGDRGNGHHDETSEQE